MSLEEEGASRGSDFYRAATPCVRAIAWDANDAAEPWHLHRDHRTIVRFVIGVSCLEAWGAPTVDTLVSIKVFRQVVESGSFVAAAERLSLSTAMTTKHILHIEKRLVASSFYNPSGVAIQPAKPPCSCRAMRQK